VKKNENIISSLHSISATIVLALNVVSEQLESLLFFTNVIQVKIIMLFLINTVLYAFLYHACVWVYLLYLKIKNPQCDISGTWYHYHYVEGDSNYLRFGIVNIKKDFYRVKMMGENYSVDRVEDKMPIPRNEKVTYWHSIMGELSESGKIITCYLSESTSGEGAMREEIHHFTVVNDFGSKNKPKKIIGKFKDGAPCRAHGCIVMYRSMEERNKAMIEIYNANRTRILNNQDADVQLNNFVR